MRKLLILFFLLCILTGCNSRTVVTGTAKFDTGEPIPKGSVVFQNTANGFEAAIGKDGTFRTADKTYKGIPAGHYRVFIKGSQTKTFESGVMMLSEPVPAKYCAAASSDLTFEVKSGGSKTFDIVIEKPAAPRVTVHDPAKKTAAVKSP